jgi:hypothetical protein
MMQQMMMQMMQNQGGNQAPAAPASENPQTKEEIMALIDGLDSKLAKGEISEATYNRLVAKWEERLKGMG